MFKASAYWFLVTPEPSCFKIISSAVKGLNVWTRWIGGGTLFLISATGSGSSGSLRWISKLSEFSCSDMNSSLLSVFQIAKSFFNNQN